MHVFLGPNPSWFCFSVKGLLVGAMSGMGPHLVRLIVVSWVWQLVYGTGHSWLVTVQTVYTMGNLENSE